MAPAQLIHLLLLRMGLAPKRVAKGRGQGWGRGHGCSESSHLLSLLSFLFLMHLAWLTPIPELQDAVFMLFEVS